MSDDCEFYLINYDASQFCKKRLDDYGDKSLLARINLAVHPFVYPQALIGDEIKEEIVEMLYLTELDPSNNNRKNTNPHILGL